MLRGSEKLGGLKPFTINWLLKADSETVFVKHIVFPCA